MSAQKGLFQELETAAALFSDGDWIESKDQDSSGNVRLIQLADIGDGSFINKSNRFMNIETAKRLNCTFLNKGDILIARMPDPLGRCCIFPFDEHEKYVTVVDIAILRLKNNFDNSYIKHLINTPQIRHEISIQTTGTTRTRITRKKLEKLRIPLPPLTEQQKIAAILDATDSLRQKNQQLVERHTALSQSLFLEMFGDPLDWSDSKVNENWSKKQIKSIALLKRGYDLPIQLRVDGEIKIFAANGIVGNHNVAKVKGPGVITGRSGTLGKVIYTDSDFWPLNTSLYVTNFNNNNPVYISWFLSFYKLDRYHRGAGVPTLNRNLFLDEWSYLPSITLQNQFAERIQLIEAQKQQAQLSLEKSEALFNSLLQRAFTGELTAKMAA